MTFVFLLVDLRAGVLGAEEAERQMKRGRGENKEH